MRILDTAAVLFLVLAAGAFAAPKYLVYVGAYTGGNGKGIELFRFDGSTGKEDGFEVAAETPNPSFLAAHPNGRFLYAVNETNAGAVSAFAIDGASGRLKQLNQVSSRGSGPCHLSLDRTGRTLLVANYNSGSIAAYRVKEDGSLGELTAFVQHTGSSVNPARQRGPHAHFIETSPDNRFAVVCDLGLDEVLVYRFDAAAGTLTPNDPPFAKVAPGAGPRHLAFGRDGRFAYVVTEMQPGVTAFAWNAASGTLKPLQTVSTLPPGYQPTAQDSGAEIAVDPRGRFVYATNRGHNSIAVFAIDAARGTLAPVEVVPGGGRIPRSFGIDPEGKWLLAVHQDSKDMATFRIDAKTGRLKSAAPSHSFPGAPVSVVFVPVK